MVARLRAWWQKISKYPVLAILVFLASALGFALIVVLVLGYWLNWHWTGLSQKTLWDWLQLLIIPLVLAVAALLFNLANSRTEQQIALDNQREAALQTYLDKMSELLLKEHLGELAPDGKLNPEYEEVRKIARVRTLAVLPRLDANRKGNVLQFLYDASLIDKKMPIINLKGTDFTGANLMGADLTEAELRGANLQGANLQNAILMGASLREANLREANLQGYGTTLFTANMSHTNLERAILRETNVVQADLQEVNLKEANLQGADLREANLNQAKNTTTEQLKTARSLQGATMPDGSKQP
jgi:hypothetical protein